MTIQPQKNAIAESIRTIKKLDLNKLSPGGVFSVQWNGLDQIETSTFIERITDILWKIEAEPDILTDVPIDQLNDLKNNLDAFISNYEPLKSLTVEGVTSHHHNSLNNLNRINQILRSNGLYTQLKISENLDDVIHRLKEVNKELKNFSSEKFTKAIGLVEDLLKRKSEFEERTIRENLGTFINRAEEHSFHRNWNFWSWKIGSGYWWWLFFSVIMGIIIAAFVFSFIWVLENNGGITIGAAIMRVSSLIVPSYFLFFCIGEYTYNKEMYETYSFKNTALNIMTELMKTNQTKSDDILEKGLNILFNEPHVKENGKYDKQFVYELLSILKSQLNR